MLNSQLTTNALPADITAYTEVSGLDFFIIKGSAAIPVVTNGTLVASPPEIKVGDKVRMDYKWQISSANMPHVQEGNYFEINLPDSTYISTITDTQPLYAGAIEIGSYTLSAGKLRVTFNAAASTYSELNHGFFQIEGSTKAAGNAISLSSDGSLTISVKPGSGGSGGGGSVHTPDSVNTALPDSKLVFGKTGKKNSGKNRLFWNMNVNYAGLRDMAENNAIVTKSRLILEDTLPLGVVPDLSSIYIYVPVFAITDSGKMSGYSLKAPKTSFALLTPNTGEAYADFYSRVQNHGSLAVGYYPLQNKFLVGFGNIPGALTYHNLFGGAAAFNSFVDSYVTSGQITAAHATLIKQRYSDTGPSGGSVMAFDVNFDADVVGPSADYANVASLSYDGATPDLASISVAVSKTAAGVGSLLDITITKQWVGTPQSSATIFLLADGVPVASVSLHAGTTPAWSHTFMGLDPSKTYTVEEIVPAGYSHSISGDAATGFVITNTENTPTIPATPTTPTTPPTPATPTIPTTPPPPTTPTTLTTPPPPTTPTTLTTPPAPETPTIPTTPPAPTTPTIPTTPPAPTTPTTPTTPPTPETPPVTAKASPPQPVTPPAPSPDTLASETPARKTIPAPKTGDGVCPWIPDWLWFPAS